MSGLPDYRGLKLCYEKNGLDGFPDIRRIGIEVRQDRILLEKTGTTGSGGNSGFQALNLVVQWGARKVLLIGFDMNGSHWYGRNYWHGANNPDDGNFRRWIAAFQTAAGQLRQMGVEVVNCSLHSALNCFPKMSLEEAINGTS